MFGAAGLVGFAGDGDVEQGGDADGDIRHVPIHPDLVVMFREHIAAYGTGPSGRIFIGPRGGILTDRAYWRVFHDARAVVWTPNRRAGPTRTAEAPPHEQADDQRKR